MEIAIVIQSGTYIWIWQRGCQSTIQRLKWKFHVDRGYPIQKTIEDSWLILHWLISSLTLSFSLFCLGLKTMKFDLIIFIESLLTRHQSVRLSYPSFKVFSIKFKFLWEKRFLYHQQKEWSPKPLRHHRYHWCKLERAEDQEWNPEGHHIWYLNGLCWDNSRT